MIEKRGVSHPTAVGDPIYGPN